MLKKIYQELVAIRKELQAIRRNLELLTKVEATSVELTSENYVARII